MKYWIFLLFTALISIVFIFSFSKSNFNIIEDTNKIAPSDPNNVINKEELPEEDPLRQWTEDIMYWTNLKNPWSIKDKEKAQKDTLTYIRDIINYFLALLWFFTLIYLLYHWFLMVTASWNEEKYKKWREWLKTATIALIWIGLSWFIISLIIYLVDIITK